MRGERKGWSSFFSSDPLSSTQRSLHFDLDTLSKRKTLDELTRAPCLRAPPNSEKRARRRRKREKRKGGGRPPLSLSVPRALLRPRDGPPFPRRRRLLRLGQLLLDRPGGGRIRSITPYAKASSALKYLLRLKSRWTSAMGFPVALQSTALT